MVKAILNENFEFLNSFAKADVTFTLALSVTKTLEIEGITQAGLNGKIHLTPTLDSEYLATKKVFSIDNIASTEAGIPSPALITRACYDLKQFNLMFLDLGLAVKPKNIELKEFGIEPSNRIDEGANINAKEIFQKGIEFAKEIKGDHFILAESVPSGTTTAEASARALGYDVDGMFASSFKDNPDLIKEKVITKTLLRTRNDMDVFDRLSIVSDNMLIFYSGFVSELSKKAKIILAGGTQLATVLLIINSLSKDGLTFDSTNIALATTKWIAEDKNSDIKSLLELLDFKILAFYSDFSFESSSFDVLKLYDRGDAKEGVGAGGSLVYANICKIDNQTILKTIESNLLNGV